jgi:hypothetical protein
MADPRREVWSALAAQRLHLIVEHQAFTGTPEGAILGIAFRVINTFPRPKGLGGGPVPLLTGRGVVCLDHKQRGPRTGCWHWRKLIQGVFGHHLHVEVHASHDVRWWWPVEELPLKGDGVFALSVMGQIVKAP